MNEEAASGQSGPSKSARKRAATSLQDLGVQLAELDPQSLDELALPDNLHAAILQLQRIHSRAAQVRQRQYIGKLMRHVDAEPIIAKLDERKRKHDLQVRRFQRMEHWRDRLLEAPDTAIEELLAEQSHADRSTLIRLIALTRHQRANQLTPTGARELFVYIRGLFDNMTA